MIRSIIYTAFVLIAGTVSAQNLPVSEVPEMKKAVIEEFTAFRCGNCPYGHQLTNEIGANLGEENLLVIAYHVGGLAEPQSAGDPDFRTSEGNILLNHFNIAATPTGPVNRSSFGTSNFVVNSNSWAPNSEASAMDTAAANVALDVSINHNTREVSINTELFYTTPSNETHYLSIGFLEEGIIGPQTTYNTNWNANYFYPNGDYYHQHVFRGYINSSQGDSIDASVSGVISNDYSFVVPQEINGQPVDIYSLEFFAMLHEGLNGPSNSEIINAAKSVDEFVGISEKEVLDVITAPNPSDGTFRILGLTDSDAVQVVDLSGRNVAFVRSGNEIQIESNGTYLVKVITGDRITTTRILVR